MWCKNCNIETNDAICPVCGAETVEDLPVEVYWCDSCNIPLIHTANQIDKGICPICAHITRYLTADLRPVFSVFCFLLALLVGEEPNAFMEKSVWATDSRYYIDGGKPINLSTKKLSETDTDKIASGIAANQDYIDYTAFDAQIKTFTLANRHRLDYIIDEAFSFVRSASSKYREEKISRHYKKHMICSSLKERINLFLILILQLMYKRLWRRSIIGRFIRKYVRPTKVHLGPIKCF